MTSVEELKNLQTFRAREEEDFQLVELQHHLLWEPQVPSNLKL
jgi:hypothetical protein